MNTSVEGLSLVTVIALIRKEIAESRAVGKAGADGKQGAKGDRGAKGDSGPAGRQGPKGNDGKQGKPGKDGTVGEDGTDGVGIKDIEQDIDGAITVTMTDGEVYTLDMPLPGETQVHYKVGGGSSSGGDSGSVDLSNYYTKSEVDALINVDGGDITLNKVTALKGNFGGAQDLRSFNIFGTGMNGRLSLQGASNTDNPGIEMTTDSNVTRVLQRIARAGTNGTELQVFTQRDGGGIHLPFVFGEGGEFFLRPKGSTNSTPNDAGFRNQSGTLEFRNDNGVWTAFDTAGKDGVDGKDGDSFFQDIGNNTIEYFGDQLWVTSLRDPIFIGAKIGSDSEFTGTVTANKFVGDGSGLTGTASAKVLVDAFTELQEALSNETTVAGLKKALTTSLAGLIETLEREQ